MHGKQTIDDVLIRVNRNINLWEGGPVNTYNTALTNAYNSFSKTLDDQSKKDALQMEVLFLIGFVVAGTLLSAGVGAAGTYFATKATGGKVAKLISRPKMSGLVNGVTTFANTGIIKTLASNLASEVKIFGKTFGKGQMVSQHSASAAIGNPRTIADVKSLLLHDLTDTYQEIHDLAVWIKKSSAPDTLKDECAEWLMKRPFMLYSVPDIRIQQRSLETVIELTFLFDHILTMDKMVTVAHSKVPAHVGPGEVSNTIGNTPITGSYREGTYPTPKPTSASDYSSNFYTTQHVGYTDPGNTVAARINTLLKKTTISQGKPDFMVDDSWFKNEMGKEQIVKAEEYLVNLMALNQVKAATSFQ